MYTITIARDISDGVPGARCGAGIRAIPDATSPNRKRGALAAILAVLLPLGVLDSLTPAHAQSAPPATAAAAPAPAPMPQEQLDSLLAPIALYPDQLLAQALMASTYPLDVVSAARFVEANKELKGEALDKAVMEKDWDPSIQSLTAYPQVLLMMNEKLEWTQQLGDAFLTDQKRVMDTVQSLRQKAYQAGNLQSSEQQKVVVQEKVIIIEPAQPEVVYVPSYNPTVVYGSWWAPAYPPYYYPPPPYYYPAGGMVAAGLIGFGLGMAISDNHWGWNDCDWGGGDVDINIDNSRNNFVNNNQNFKNRTNNGNWNHNPSQRKGVGYGNQATRDRYSKSDPGAVSSRRDARGYDSSGARGGSSQYGDRSSAGNRATSAGTRDAQRSGQYGDRSASSRPGTSDAQRSSSNRSYGSGASSRDRSGSGSYNRSSSSRSSLDTRSSRQRTQSYSNRGASSRSSMSSMSRGGGGFSRGGGGGGRRR